MVKLSIENQNRLKAYPLSYECKGKILENFKYYSFENMDHKQMKQIYWLFRENFSGWIKNQTSQRFPSAKA